VTEAEIEGIMSMTMIAGRGLEVGMNLVKGAEGRTSEEEALSTTSIDKLYLLQRTRLHHGDNQKRCIQVEEIIHAMEDQPMGVEALIFWKGMKDNSDVYYGLIYI